MNDVYYYILVRPDGSELSLSGKYGGNGFFSYESAEADARLIAKAMYRKDGIMWGYRIVKCDYEPRNVGEKNG